MLRVGCSAGRTPTGRVRCTRRARRRRPGSRATAELFDTVELNNTFYRLPPVDDRRGWAAQAPPGFLYSVKLGEFGSHRMKLRDPVVVADEPPRPGRAPRRPRGPEPGAAAAALEAQRRAPRRVPRRVAPSDDALGGRAPGARPGCTTTCSTCSRRHGAALCIHDLLARPPVDPHRRLDLPPLSRSASRSTTEIRRTLRRRPPLAGSPTASTRGSTRAATFRLLQQRLQRRRGPRREWFHGSRGVTSRAPAAARWSRTEEAVLVRADLVEVEVVVPGVDELPDRLEHRLDVGAARDRLRWRRPR